MGTADPVAVREPAARVPVAVPAAGGADDPGTVITDAGRERLARWLFAQLSPLAAAGVHWVHLGTSARLVWLDHADDVIGLLREDPDGADTPVGG